MTRPRFPLSKAHEEKQVRSEAADRLGDPIQSHESESNNNREHGMNDPSFPSRSDYPRQDFFNQILSVTPARSASSDQRPVKANHPEPNLPWYGSEKLNSDSKILFLPAGERTFFSADTQAIQASKRSIEQNPGYEVTSTTNKIVAWPRRASVESENRARETFQPDEQDTYEIYHGTSHVCPNSCEQSRPTEYPDNHRSMDINQVSHQYLPSTAAQVRSTELQNLGPMPPDQSSLQAVDYSRREQGSPKLLGTVSPSGLNSNESQITYKEQSQTEPDAELSYHFIILRRKIEEYLSAKPYREESKALVQHVFGAIDRSKSSSGLGTKFLQRLERQLTTKALVSGLVRNNSTYLFN